MDYVNLLSKIGLSDKESSIYLALLDLGPSTVSGISKKTGLHRPAIYKILPLLLTKGLVSNVPKGKQKHYIAEPPDKLRLALNEIVQEFNTAIPELASKKQHLANKSIAKFIEGKSGIKWIYNDLVRRLNRGDTFYRYSSRKAMTNGEKYLPSDYRIIRDQKQLQRFVITNKKVIESRKQELNREEKSIPSSFDLFEYDIAQIIYDGKVAFIDYNTETAVLIENPIIANFQKKIFKLLYDKL